MEKDATPITLTSLRGLPEGPLAVVPLKGLRITSDIVPPFMKRDAADKAERQRKSDYIDAQCRMRFSRVWKIHNSNGLRGMWNRLMFVFGR